MKFSLPLLVRGFSALAAAALTALVAVPAQAQTIGLPQTPGVFVTFGGGGHGADAPGVAAFGDLSSRQQGDLDGAAADAVAVALGSTPNVAFSASPANSDFGSQVVSVAAVGDNATAAQGATFFDGTDAGTVSVTAQNDTSGATITNSAGSELVASAQSIGPGPQAATALSVASSTGTSSASASPNGGRLIDADSGTWFSGSIGYAFALDAGLLGAVEAYGRRYHSDDDAGALGAAAFRTVDNQAAFAASSAPISNLSTTANQDVRFSEFGVRLKAGNAGGPLPLIVGVEPFYISYEQDTESASLGNSGPTVSGLDARRRSDVDARLYGAQLGLDTQVPIGKGFFWLARVSGGFYRVEADGDFASDISVPSFPFQHTARVYDDEGAWGYRAGVETGLRIAFTSALALSLTGGLDYLSDLPTAALPREGGDRAAHVEMDDLTSWRFGAQLTVAFGGP